MLIIPTIAVPAQTFTCILANQAVRIDIAQKGGLKPEAHPLAPLTNMFASVYVNDSPIVSGVICQDRNRLVRDAYFGFVGDLMFLDTQGRDDPYYTGLGTRWLLAYLEVIT